MQVFNRVGEFGLYGIEGGVTRLNNNNTWFVDGNSGNAGNISTGSQGQSWSLPFSTLNYAISQASAGDVILVAAGHTETIQDTGTASGTVTDELVVDKTALTIIGMGTGARRPTFTLSGATDASCVILSPECTLKNLVFISDLADVAAGISIGALGDGFVIENCEFRDGGAVKELVIGISIAANADDGIIRGCRFFTTDAGSSTASGIKAVGAHARLQIYDNYFRGDWNTAAMDLSTAAGTDVLIKDNVVNNLDAAAGIAITLHASTTGAVIHNLLHGGKDGTTPLVTTAALAAENYYTNAEAASAAILTPATDS